MYVFETHQVAIVDQYLCKHGVTMMELIEMAGKAFYKHVKKFNRPFILAGFGNNGADALQVAKLYQSDHKKVDVYLYRKELMNEQCQKLIGGLNIVDSIELDKYDVIIDGIFGAGLNREIGEDLKEILDQVNQSQLPKYSIDIPSGLNGDGKIYDLYFHCDQVITFMALKKLYLIQEYRHLYHEVIVERLKIDEEVFIQNRIAKLIDEEYALHHLKIRHYDDYKNRNGVICHITGSKLYTGAMIMAAGGSIFSGSGIVKVCTNEESKLVLNQHFPEAVYISRDDLKIDQEDAYLIGCGLGQSQESEILLKNLLLQSSKPVVIDADGLNILANHLDWLASKKCQVVLTPHIGEYHRLDPQNNIESFVNRYDCIVILKGPQTKVVTKEKVYMNSTGNKAMAIGGSGDTLAGVVVSLIGQGYLLEVACNLAVYFHGKAGDLLAKDYYSVLPTDLAREIGKEMRRVESIREK